MEGHPILGKPFMCSDVCVLNFLPIYSEISDLQKHLSAKKCCEQ